jgi:hypothetical protein
MTSAFAFVFPSNRPCCDLLSRYIAELKRHRERQRVFKKDVPRRVLGSEKQQGMNSTRKMVPDKNRHVDPAYDSGGADLRERTIIRGRGGALTPCDRPTAVLVLPLAW